MPVVTRSKSRLSHTVCAAESQLALKLSKTTNQPPRTTNPVAYKHSVHLERIHSSLENVRKPSCEPQASINKSQSHASDENQSQASIDESQPQASDENPASSEKESLQVATKHSLVNDTTKTFWPCRKCSCDEGIFKALVNYCVTCGHTMDDHESEWEYPWNPQCDYLCDRKELVKSIIQHVRQYGVVIIRATPQVGKSILLKLVGHHVVQKESDLDPIHLYWENREKRKNLPYNMFLEQKKAIWQEINAKIRPRNPAAQTIYLIDEAQGSYEEKDFWSLLENIRNKRAHSLYVLVCVYGAAGISYLRNADIESQAQRMHALHRIELRPSIPGNPCMLFSHEEVNNITKKFAIDHGYTLDHGVAEYLYHATDGHPGMVGVLLSYFHFLPLETSIQIPQTLPPQVFYELLIQHEYNFADWLNRWGRGLWTVFGESFTEHALHNNPDYSHLRLLDIKKVLREVALRPNGITRSQTAFDDFGFCHKMGLLNTETPVGGSSDTTFVFASPLHRRVAYRRLFPGGEPDAVLKSLSLQQICINAIARFSPSALQNRRFSKSSKSWSIPEAAFQDELYCCLNLELHYLPILSEYAHTKDGRIDFYISDQKWGIEVLQCGGNADMARHTSRFMTSGRYQRWNIMDDYIILNFCPRSALQKLTSIADQEIQSHVFHVVIEPDELIADIYTHDKQLRESWSLSEGRQRAINEKSYKLDDSASDTNIDLQAESTQAEIKLQMNKMKLQMDKMGLEREREREDLRLQLEREREKMRQERERGENRGNATQAQYRLEKNRKRKR